MKLSGGNLISIGAALNAIFDVLEPIFSIGPYALIIFAGLFVYYFFLSRKYLTAEELRSSKIAGANHPALKEFFEENWRFNAIIILLVLVAISTAGTIYTDQHKENGGFIAAHSTVVRSMQKSLEELLKGQGEIKASLGDLKEQSSRLEEDASKIKDSIQAIHENTRTPTLKVLAEQARRSDDPYEYLRVSMEQLHFEMTYNPDDFVYITNILKERNSNLLSTLAYKFLDTCKKDAYSEDTMLKIFRNLRSGNIERQNLFASRLEAVKLCLSEEPSNAMVEFFLTDENGRYSTTFYENTTEMRELFNSCSTPINLSFFSKAVFLPDSLGHNLHIHNLHKIIRVNAMTSLNCISDEAAILLNERYNRVELLARGYYLKDKQIYSGKCNPSVSLSEIKNAQRIGVRIREHVIRDAIDNNCIHVN